MYNTHLAYFIISVRQKLYYLRKYVRVQKTSLQTFRVALSMADLHNVMSMLDCLRSCSCSEFQACTCNIIYKSPCFRDTRKGLPLSFSHGTYHCGLVEAVARHKNHPAESLFRTMEFFYKEPFLQERIDGILFM